MRPTATYDAVVVGARPAGAATAMLLARAGLRVLVVDRAAYGADTVSTHALLRGGVLQLARWGLLDRIAAAGTPAVGRCIFRYGRRDLEVPIKPRAGVDALYAPRRTVLDPILVDAARDAGADVRFGVSVTGLAGNGRVTGVVGHDEQGRAFAATAQITIGADGIGSSVSRLVGAPVELSAESGAAFIYGYCDGLPADRYQLWYQPGVAVGSFPTNRGQACVFAASPPERMRRELGSGAGPAYTKLLAEAAPELLDGVCNPGRLRLFAGRRTGYVRRSHGPGWALVGDAGYYKDPITSHGLTDALRDAELLSQAIIVAAGGETAEPTALAGYQSDRDRLSARLFAVTDQIASFRWDLDRIPGLLTELSDAMVDEMNWLSELDARHGRPAIAPSG
jgi:2-polyprenyl-6-methoxyphenol hydroxylase-like FAD-dependent oxidoreductase